jgi:hypothetical protein
MVKRGSIWCSWLILSLASLLVFAPSAGAAPLDEILRPVEETVAPIKQVVETVTAPVLAPPPAAEPPAPAPATTPEPTSPPPARSPAPVKEASAGLEGVVASAGEAARYAVEGASETVVRTAAGAGAPAGGGTPASDASGPSAGAPAAGVEPTGGPSPASASPAATPDAGGRAGPAQPDVASLPPGPGAQEPGAKNGDGGPIAAAALAFRSRFVFVWPALALGGPFGNLAGLDDFLSTWSRATLADLNESRGAGSLRGNLAPAGASSIGRAIAVTHSPASSSPGLNWIPGSGDDSVLVYLLLFTLAGLAILVVVRRHASEEKEPHG